MPYGSLEVQEPFSQTECVAILQQCLSALEYLHTRSRPIIHRDIKPANILVYYRNEGASYLHVKLSDFGLAKQGTPNTHCGSKMYTAPEIIRVHKYTSAVDVWSLGVVILELAHGLPSSNSANWCEAVAARAQNWTTHNLGICVASMLRIDPRVRAPASKSTGSQTLPEFRQTPGPAYPGQQYGSSVEPIEVSRPFTFEDARSSRSSGTPIHGTIFAREPAPSPSTTGPGPAVETIRKRPKHTTSSSSRSSHRTHKKRGSRVSSKSSEERDRKGTGKATADRHSSSRSSKQKSESKWTSPGRRERTRM